MRTQTKTKIIMFIVILVGCAIMLYPPIWMIASSFKPEAEIFSNKSLRILTFTLENYIKGFKGISGVSFGTYLINTLKIVIPVCIGTTISSAMTGYAFARLNFPGKKIFFGCMFLMMLMPVHAALIPRYLMFNAFGWTGTNLPLTVPAFFATQTFFVYLYVQFIRGLPKELDEAAKIDGCSPIGIFFRIIVPMTTPATVTAAVFSFIWTWDDFFSQLIYINDPSKYTVSLGLRQYMESMQVSSFGTMFAMSAISLIPLLIFFISCQKYLVEGIATSGLKG